MAKPQNQGEPWGESEKEIVRLHYPTEGARCKERLPGRSAVAVYQMAYRLNTYYDPAAAAKMKPKQIRKSRRHPIKQEIRDSSGEEGGAKPLEATIKANHRGVLVEFRPIGHEERVAEVYLEIFDNELRLYVWEGENIDEEAAEFVVCELEREEER